MAASFSSFSRALRPQILLLVRPQLVSCECAATQARLLLRARLSTTRLLQKAARSPRPLSKPAAKPANATAAPKTAPARTTPSTTTAAAARTNPATAQAARALPSTYAEQLARKGRTLLYEAPSHFWFRAGCFSSAAFCVSYTVYQYWTVILHPPEGLMWWIPHAYALVLLVMSGMGAYFVMGAGRIVRSIEAVPASAAKLQAASSARAGAAAAAAATMTPIYIEVAMRRPVPFAPPKKMLLRPEEVQLPFRMFALYSGGGPAAALGQQQQQQQAVGLAERVRAERAARDARIAERKYTMDHILTAPFRDAGKAFGSAWVGIRRSFNREGFAKIKLKDREYKIDVTGGWALDEGRAMDRLLPVRPNALRG